MATAIQDINKDGASRRLYLFGFWAYATQWHGVYMHNKNKKRKRAQSTIFRFLSFIQVSRTRYYPRRTILSFWLTTSKAARIKPRTTPPATRLPRKFVNDDVIYLL